MRLILNEIWTPNKHQRSFFLPVNPEAKLCQTSKKNIEFWNWAGQILIIFFQLTMNLGKGNDCLKSEEGEKGLWDVIRTQFQEWNTVVRKFWCWPKQTLGWAHSCCCQWWGVWSWCCCCPWTEWAGFEGAVGPRSWWSKEAKKQQLPKLRFQMRVTL